MWVRGYLGQRGLDEGNEDFLLPARAGWFLGWLTGSPHPTGVLVTAAGEKMKRGFACNYKVIIMM